MIAPPEGSNLLDPVLLLDVTLSAPVDQDVVVDVQSNFGFAPLNNAIEWNPLLAPNPFPPRNGGDDYVVCDGWIKWPAGSFGSVAIPITIISDQLPEPDELFEVSVSWPPALGMGPYKSIDIIEPGSSVVITILNDDFTSLPLA